MFLFSCNKVDKIQSTQIEIPSPPVRADTINGDYIAIIDSEFQLNKSDEKQIQELLIKSVEQYNSKHSKNTIDLRYYKRQYFPKVKNDERVVEVCCYCSTIGDDWKVRYIDVDDGGKCYFRVSVNLTKNQCSEIQTNGNG